ncbi:hypothetical protein PDESU_00567 [Pontiella desulfatans]|uniref:Uncharacterized protein n=1 Tax=Pontiella desulfatans TaxID=2750659 RepID=A0A6C2TWM6_PONDE|nr:hypothetical protein [Pontiella desulfatans]VGO12019.1 hypothetical protein PDESU_00567 [Pontiella desulfatans]
MLKVILAKIGISLFRCLPLEQIVAKLMTGAIQKLLKTRKATKVVDRVRKTVTHLVSVVSIRSVQSVLCVPPASDLHADSHCT